MRVPLASPPEVQVVRSISAARAAARSRLDTPLRPAPPKGASAPHGCVTLMTGIDAGRLVAVDREVVLIGRDDEVDLRVDDPAVSRRHARLMCGPGDGYRIEDLDSTNGTYVRGERVYSAQLYPGDHIQLGPNTLLRFALADEQDELLQRRLFESSVRDPLTGSYNRQHFAARLGSEMAHARRTGRDISVLMLDIDHFKRFNDNWGHLAGDRVLCSFHEQVTPLLRAEDVFARYGGDEFVVLARDAGLAQATELGERLRDALSASPIRIEASTLRVTVSVGAASLSELGPHPAPPELIGRADERLYRAKLSGRNRVCGVE